MKEPRYKVALQQGRELGEELAGRRPGLEGALVREDDVRIERKKAGGHIVEKLLAAGLQETAGWGEENEGLAQAGEELGDGTAEFLPVGLDREDDRDGVGGPRPGDLTNWSGGVLSSVAEASAVA